MRHNYIGIDMGSSNTAIYQAGYGVSLFEPSVVALSGDDRRKIKEVGIEAKKLIGRTSDSTVVIAPVFESEIEDESAASSMLEKFLNKVTLNKLSARPKVIISVPCGIELAGVRRFEKVLLSCDVTDYSFVETPILAALGLGIPMSESSPCFIIDIGGGTTQIAAVSLDGIICGICVNMGGISIDAMLQTYIEDKYGLKIGALTAERMKIAIGSLVDGDDTRTVINGRDVMTGRPRALSIVSNEIVEPFEVFFDKIFQITGMVLSKLPAEVSADIRKAGIYFSGGVSKTVGLEDYFRRKMEMRANISKDAELLAVTGAGIIGSNVELLKKIRINKR